MARKGICKNCLKFKRLCECGRPETITPEIEAKIEEYLRDGTPLVKALAQAGAKRTTYYRKLENDPVFRDKMRVAKYHLTIVARKSFAIGVAKNPALALAYLERKEPEEFNLKHEHVHKGTITHKYSEIARKRLGKYTNSGEDLQNIS